jgi:hypothetical protein
VISRHLWIAAAWLVAAAGLAAMGWAGTAPIGDRPAPPSGVGTIVRRGAERWYPGDSLVTTTSARNAFRADRRPAAVAYDPQRVGVIQANAASKPLLLLVGLVAGTMPTAVIEGFPGVEGSRVVRAGDEVSGLRVLRIEAERVVITGMDTTWVLRVREPWRP